MPRWGMVVDAAKCTGCGACIAACNQENNIPTAGPAQSALGRAMYWMRFITEYRGDYPKIKVHRRLHFCYHCDHPPCTVVCPVHATMRGEDGIVGQIYTRCIGCRYCMAACPYNVKVFNWYKPRRPESFAKKLNPDVSERMNGVVEKCTFCHHRLQRARDQARSEKRELMEGEYVPACVEICPTNALAFGDLDDPESEVARLARNPRAYRPMEDLGTEPKVYFLPEPE